MKKDDIKTLTVIVIICVICIVIGVILSIKTNFEKLSPVNEYSSFYSQVKYINNYINTITNRDSIGIYNLLDKKYIEENNITQDNVLEHVTNYTGMCFAKISSMKSVKIRGNYIYLAQGKIYKSGFENETVVDDNFSIIVINDYDNLSFSIYPINNNDKEVINNIKKINIEKNKYNVITDFDLINKEQICVTYLSDYLDKLSNNIKDSYEVLSNDMKKVYTTEDMYINYINNNINQLSTVADKCKVEELDKKRMYTVIDSKGNTYIFTEESIMNYKVDFYLKESNE